MEKEIKINIPVSLHEKVETMIKDTEFETVSEYVIYVLQELTSEEEVKDAPDKEDEEKVKERLRSLGYLD